MSKPMKYVPGEWKVICDSCGLQFLASELLLRWDGMRVCRKDWETRHPQDFVRAKTEVITPPWTRPETDDIDNIYGYWVNNSFVTIPWENDSDIEIPWQFDY